MFGVSFSTRWNAAASHSISKTQEGTLRCLPPHAAILELFYMYAVSRATPGRLQHIMRDLSSGTLGERCSSFLASAMMRCMLEGAWNERDRWALECVFSLAATAEPQYTWTVFSTTAGRQ